MTVTDMVCQEQLQPSSRSGYVTVVCVAPDGLRRDDGTASEAGDVYSMQPDGTLQTRRAGTDAGFEQAKVLPNGNLLYQPVGVRGFGMLGAGLRPL